MAPPLVVDQRAVQVSIFEQANAEVVIVVEFDATVTVTDGTWSAIVRDSLSGVEVAAFSVVVDGGANTVTYTIPQATAQALIADGADEFVGVWGDYNDAAKRPYHEGPFVLRQGVVR